MNVGDSVRCVCGCGKEGVIDSLEPIKNWNDDCVVVCFTDGERSDVSMENLRVTRIREVIDKELFSI